MKTLARGKIGVVTLATVMAACSAFAEEAMVKGINWRYSVSDDKACIEGLADMPAADGKSVEECNQKMVKAFICKKKLAFPGKIDKYPVTSIGEAVLTLAEGPSSITVPASVTSIGKEAFMGNKNLTSVVLPPNLARIPDALFHTCENLKAVKIPASVKSIGVEAFAECRGLKSIAIPQGVADIDRQAFRDCANLASVTIPASVTNVGESAFARCGKLAKIDVAKGSRAYKSVAGALYTKDGTTLVAWPAGNPAATVTVPDGVTGIGPFAFADCPKITTITIPASVVKIGESAFVKCPKLSAIYTDADNVDRLKTLIADGGRDDGLGNIKIEAKAEKKQK